MTKFSYMDQSMFPIFLLVLIGPLGIYGGSPCPPREDLYPCSCANVQISKKAVHTLVTCHRLHDSDALARLVPSLRTMQVDQFHMYDSFWGEEGGKGGLLPSDWISMLRVKEWVISDTKLATCFACGWKKNCKNTITNRFTLVNSTGEDLCTLCETDKVKNQYYPWTSCLSRLQYLHVSGSPISDLGISSFPLPMPALTSLNLTRNNIATVHAKALEKLTSLANLDLSHNALQYIDFLGYSKKLQYVDLSWNNIKEIGPIFGKLPSLVTFKVESNEIQILKETDWKDVPEKLWYVDLSDNPLHCDCGVRFLNDTFHVSAVVRGSCASPEDYEGSLLRRASRLLNERCDEAGSIGTRAKKMATTPMHG